MTRVVVGHGPSAAHVAGRLVSLLRPRFGTGNVRLWSGGPDSGGDRPAAAATVAAVRAGDVLVVLVDRSWTAAVDRSAGGRVLVAPALDAAVAGGIPVVVVLVEGAAPPDPEDLPARHRPLPLDHATFRSDVESIIERVGAVTGARRRPSWRTARPTWQTGLAVSPARAVRRVVLWWAVFATAALSSANAARLFAPRDPAPGIGGGFALVELALFGLSVVALRKEIRAQRHLVERAPPGVRVRAARRRVSRGRMVLLGGLCAALAVLVAVRTAG